MAEGDKQESFTTLARLMEKEEYEAALAMVRSLQFNTDGRFEDKINKIEANLLASTLGSLAYFQRLLQSSLL
jgi:hypothetical protein